MNTQTQEALNMAIQWLESPWNAPDIREKVINALTEALNIANCDLKQPAQNLKLIEDNGNGIKTYEILPTHQWQGLTDDEINEILEKTPYIEYGSWIEFAQDIEQELKTKNGFSDIKEKNHG